MTVLSEDEVFDRVRDALRGLDRRWADQDITRDTSLVGDLAIDSIRLVDLTFAIEDRLGFGEFPMQEWADDEMQKTSGRFTVGSLVQRCRLCLQGLEGQRE